MIQFNKTIFQITKRLALAVMLIGISNPIWAGDVRTTFGTLTATPNPNSGENLIYLSTEKVNDVSNISYKSGIQQQDVNGNSIWFVWDWGNTTYTETTVYCYADSLGMSEGLWAGWYDETNKIIGNGEAFVEYVFTPTARNSGSWDTGNDPSRTNYTQAAITAKWVKPSVVGISAFKAFPTVTDKNNYTTTREVSFNVQDVTKTEHIDLITTEKGDFDVSDVTLTTSTENIFNATATITVGYKPTGIHTVSPKDELIHTGEVVLKNALYEGTYDNPASTSYKKVIFQVEEVYPGMETSEKIMKAENKGETASSVRCEFSSIRVFNDTVSVGDPVLDASGNPTGATHTSDTLYQLLKSYPFKTNIYFGADEYVGTPIVIPQNSNLDIKFSRNKTDNLQSKAQSYSTFVGTKSIAPEDALEMCDVTTDVVEVAARGKKYWDKVAEENMKKQQEMMNKNTDLPNTSNSDVSKKLGTNFTNNKNKISPKEAENNKRAKGNV